MGIAMLGGIPLPIDPSSVSWDFAMKIAEHQTLGGKVIQVFGTDLGDMTVSGTFGNGIRAKGDTAGWEAQERFRLQVVSWTQKDIATHAPIPLRFLYPPKRWDFQVHVKAFSDGSGRIEQAADIFNPGYSLTLFIVEDSTRKVVKGIRDLYLSRLMNGVGWKQTKYNGPDQKDVDAKLAAYGGDAGAYLKAQYFAASAAGATNTTGQP